MKHILSSDISTTARQPYTKVTHEYYNAMITETVTAICKGITGTTTTPVILYGCVNSASPNANISVGAVYYLGEIYLCDAFVDGTISDAIVGTITTVYDAADPVLFSDGASHNVHQTKKIVWSDAVSGSGDFDYADCVFVNADWDKTTLYTSLTDGLKFKKTIDGFTEIYGVLNAATSRTMPVGFRPIAAETFTTGMSITNGGTSNIGVIQVNIATNGAITTTPALNAAGAGNYTSVFVNVKYKSF